MGFRFQKKIPNSSNQILQFSKVGSQSVHAYVIWTTSDTPTEVTLDANGCFQPINFIGNKLSKVCSQDGKITLQATNSTLYLLPYQEI